MVSKTFYASCKDAQDGVTTTLSVNTATIITYGNWANVSDTCERRHMMFYSSDGIQQKVYYDGTYHNTAVQYRTTSPPEPEEPSDEWDYIHKYELQYSISTSEIYNLYDQDMGYPPTWSPTNLEGASKLWNWYINDYLPRQDPTYIPSTEPDLYQLAEEIKSGGNVDLIFRTLTEEERDIVNAYLYTQANFDDLYPIIEDVEKQMISAKVAFLEGTADVRESANLTVNSFQKLRAELSEELEDWDAGLSYALRNAYDDPNVLKALETSFENFSYKTDHLIEEEVLPLLYKLDDYGLLRSIAFMLGGIAGSIFEPDILRTFGQKLPDTKRTWMHPALGLQEEIIPGRTIHTPFSQSLSWGSRWFTGIPLYELTKKALYEEPDWEVTPTAVQQEWGAFLELQERAQQAGIIQGRWRVRLTQRLPYAQWVNRMYTSLKTYANSRGVY
jgi:hypothetical protein